MTREQTTKQTNIIVYIYKTKKIGNQERKREMGNAKRKKGNNNNNQNELLEKMNIATQETTPTLL